MPQTPVTPELGRKLYVVPLDIGVAVLVTPVSPYLRTILLEKATLVHPIPDPKPFQTKIENTLDGIELWTDADEKPEYVRLKNAAAFKRMRKYLDLIIESGIVVDTVEGSDKTLSAFKPQHQKLIELVPELAAEDPFQVLVRHILITTEDDLTAISKVATETITKEEVRRGVASFRFTIQQHASPRYYRSEVTLRYTGGHNQAEG